MHEQRVPAFIPDAKEVLRATLGVVSRGQESLCCGTDSILIEERWITSGIGKAGMIIQQEDRSTRM